MPKFPDQTAVRLKAGGPRMITLSNDPQALLLGDDFVFCLSRFKWKEERGYFRADQLVPASAEALTGPSVPVRRPRGTP